MASANWERRNARARSLGYDSYYDYRAHDNGRLPPSEPRLSGEPLARSRGHRSAADLETLLRRGQVELVNTVTTIDAKGNRVVDVLVLTADGGQREFRLRGDRPQRIGQMIDDLGVDAPPLVGSPRTLRRFQDIDDAEFEDADELDEAA